MGIPSSAASINAFYQELTNVHEGIPVLLLTLLNESMACYRYARVVRARPSCAQCSFVFFLNGGARQSLHQCAEHCAAVTVARSVGQSFYVSRMSFCAFDFLLVHDATGWLEFRCGIVLLS